MRIFIKTLKALTTTSELKELADDHRLKKPMEEWWTKMQGWDEATLQKEVMIFRVSKPKVASKTPGLPGGGDYAKVQVTVGPETRAMMEEVLIHMELLHGWQQKVGTAPKSQKERKVIDVIKQKS